MICGDFNMIYQAADKNNDRLDRRAMRRFRSFINQAQLQEVDLVGAPFHLVQPSGRTNSGTP
jgi:hypothetical protein